MILSLLFFLIKSLLLSSLVKLNLLIIPGSTKEAMIKNIKLIKYKITIIIGIKIVYSSDKYLTSKIKNKIIGKVMAHQLDKVGLKLHGPSIAGNNYLHSIFYNV